MGLLENLFGKKANNNSLVQGSSTWETLTAYKPVFRSYNERLFESELVAAAIDSRARHFSKLKLEFLGSAKPILKTKVKYKPNGFQTWSQFLYRLSVILDMQGTAFIIPVYDSKTGEHTGYFPILPSACRLIEKNNVLYIKYTFRNNQTAAMQFDKVGVLTKHQYEDDLFGTNPQVALSSILSVTDLNRQGIKEAIKTSAVYKFMAQVNNFTKTEDLKKERQRFTDENLSKENGGLLLFPNTYTNIKQIESKNYVLDKEQIDFIKSSVLNFFGVSEDILQNKANAEVFKAFFEGAIEPLGIQLAQVMSNMTFTELELSYGNKVGIFTSKLERLTVAEKFQAFDRGLFTINEAREEILGLEPVEGGDIATPRGEYHETTTTTESEGNTNANEE